MQQTNPVNGSAGVRSIIEALEGVCNIDVDAVDPRVAKNMPFKPHNQTSNQVICCNTMLLPEYRDLFLQKTKDFGHLGWEEVFNRVTVQLCADNLENITGRVLVQVSPCHVHSRDAVLSQCYAYDQAFRDAGVPRDRFAIKIPTTGPAMCAAAQLNKEGIRTLGTSLFSVPQAIAASQAGCLFISPYFNEVAAYSDSSLLHKGPDPALTHPMASRVIHILDTYAKMYKDSGKEQPLIVMASNANIAEIVATAELGCQHITVLEHHIRELANTPFDAAALEVFPFLASPPPKKSAPYYADWATPERLRHHSTSDPLAGPSWDGKLASTDLDYLSDNGSALTTAIDADAAVLRKMKDVFNAFTEADERAKLAIETEWVKMQA